MNRASSIYPQENFSPKLLAGGQKEKGVWGK